MRALFKFIPQGDLQTPFTLSIGLSRAVAPKLKQVLKQGAAHPLTFPGLEFGKHF